MLELERSRTLVLAGYRAEEDTASYADTRTKGFGTEAQRRILLGTHILTAG